MKFRHRVIQGLRVAVVGLAVMAAVAPAGVSAHAPHGGASQAMIGDTPADFPGASRAPKYDGPSTVAVVRPERTTIRDVDQTLPIVLAGVALLIAVGGAGYVVVRTRSTFRGA